MLTSAKNAFVDSQQMNDAVTATLSSGEGARRTGPPRRGGALARGPDGPGRASVPVAAGRGAAAARNAALPPTLTPPPPPATGLYSLDAALLESLAPDVLVTQSLCHVCAVDLRLVERLAAQLGSRPRVVSLNPSSLEDVISDCRWGGLWGGWGAAAGP
jgi:hypothetical protein